MDAPSEAPRAADGTPAPLAAGPVLALTALAGAATGALSLARGRALEDALGADGSALGAGALLLAFALGAGVLGSTARRARRPLAALGLLLLAATAFTLLWSAGLEALRGLRSGAPLALGLWLLLGPPGFLAGAALSAAARALEGDARRSGALALGTAALGAGAGRWVAAFHLVPDAGLDASANAATALALVLGALAVALGRVPAGTAPGAGAQEPAAGAAAGLGAAAALLGAAALALGRLSARELDLIAGPTARSSWAATAAFAALLGIGALLSLPFGRARAPLAAGLGALLAVLAGVALLLAGPYLAVALGELGALRTNPAQDTALLALTALAQSAPALGLGLVLGALAGAGGRALQRALVCAALGAAGALLLLELGPPLQRQLALRLALALVPLAAALRFRPPAQPAPALSGLVAAAALALTWGSFPARDRLVGSYLASDEARAELALLEVAFAAEGPRADVLVLAAPPDDAGSERQPALFVDGRRVQGGAARALGWLPRLLNPGARRALLDGLGTGETARVLLELGGIEVVCAEPAGALVAAAPHCGFLESAEQPGLTRVREDLRRHLAAEGPRYDLVLVDASAPWTRGATARLSSEFFQAAGARLETYGLVAVVLSTRSLHHEQLALVIRTASDVFPDVALLDAGDGLALLVATPRGLLPRVEEVDAAQALLDAAPEAAAELSAALGSSDVRALLLERLWLGNEPLRAIAARSGNAEVIADAQLSLELAAFGLAQFAAHSGGLLLAENERLLTAASDPALWQQLFLEWRASAPQLDALRAHRTRYFQSGLLEQGLALVRLALTYEPDEPEFSADLLLFADLEPRAFEVGRERLLERSAGETYRLGSSLAQLGRLEAARAVLAGLSARYPQSATALAALAEVDEALGETERAAEERARARALDPLSDAVLR